MAACLPAPQGGVRVVLVVPSTRAPDRAGEGGDMGVVTAAAPPPVASLIALPVAPPVTPLAALLESS